MSELYEIGGHKYRAYHNTHRFYCDGREIPATEFYQVVRDNRKQH